MLWPQDSLYIAFDQIRAAANDEGPSSVSTLVVSSIEVDSVCAVKLITDTLKAENIPFSTKPVNSDAEAEVVLRTMLRDGSIKSVILVNCGGRIDLKRRLGFVSDDVYFFVIDSHRPLCHVNLSPSVDKVIVFGGEIDSIDDNLPDEDDPEELDSDEEEQAENEVAENEESEGENEEPNEKFSEDAEENPEDSSREAPSPSSKKRLSSTNVSAQKRQRRERINNYYSRTYIGDPASHTVYTWLQQMGRDKNMSTWVAIVGFTSRYMMMDMDDEMYLQLVDQYRDVVLDRNRSIKSQTPVMGENGSSRSPVPSREQIEYIEEDLRLTLYRHWSLHEACCNTALVASRFGVWTPEQEGELSRVFATLGVAMTEAKQKFSYMSARNKSAVREDIDPIVRKDFNFRRMTTPSFTFRSNYGCELSADDMARCIAALLASGSTNKPEDSAKIGVDDGFSRASELLSRNDVELTSKALGLAMTHARLITDETIAIIKGGMVQSAGDFRFVEVELHDDIQDNMNEVDSNRTQFFSNPWGVIQLARNVIAAHHGQEKWLRNSGKPLVLSVMCGDSGVVIGMPCPREVGEVIQNPFGKLFARTAKDSNLEIVNKDFLDSYVVQINSSDTQRFLIDLAEAFRV